MFCLFSNFKYINYFYDKNLIKNFEKNSFFVNYTFNKLFFKSNFINNKFFKILKFYNSFYYKFNIFNSYLFKKNLNLIYNLFEKNYNILTVDLLENKYVLPFYSKMFGMSNVKNYKQFFLFSENLYKNASWLFFFKRFLLKLNIKAVIMGDFKNNNLILNFSKINILTINIVNNLNKLNYYDYYFYYNLKSNKIFSFYLLNFVVQLYFLSLNNKFRNNIFFFLKKFKTLR